MYTAAMYAEDIAKMNRKEFFGWLTIQMERNDPNGEYDAELISQSPKEVFELLLQWVEDCGGADICYHWLCLAIAKLNNIIMEGGE